MTTKYPFNGENSDNQTLPGSDRNRQITRTSSDLLPAVNQTEVVKKFLGASLDPLISRGSLEEINAYVGRKKGGIHRPTIDYYLTSLDEDKNQYRFAPGISNTSKQAANLGEIVDAVPYYDTWRKAESQGWSRPTKSAWLDSTWGFAPPINPDKFINFTNYYWIVNELPVIQIEGDIDLDEVQQSPYFTTPVQPNGKRLEFRNGMRLVFKNLGSGTVVPSSYVSTSENIYWTVDGVGDKIRLLDSSYTNLNMPYVVGDKEYIVMERGSEDRNAWSKSNRWYHYMAVYETCRFLGISTTTIIGAGSTAGNKGSRPIIEFNKNLVLWKSGITYKFDVDFIADSFSNVVDLTGLPALDIDGAAVEEGDTVLFIAGDPTVKNKVFTVTGVGTGLVWTEIDTSANNEIVIANKGTNYKWKTLHFDETVETWVLSQQKITRGQAPRFSIFDINGTPIEEYDNVPYDGSLLFGYNPGTRFDSELNFNIDISVNQTKRIVQGFENIVFKNYLDAPLTATINGSRQDIPGPYFYKRISDVLVYDGAWKLANHQRLSTKETNIQVTQDIIDSRIIPIGSTTNLLNYTYLVTETKDISVDPNSYVSLTPKTKLAFWQRDINSRFRPWPEALIAVRGRTTRIISIPSDVEIYDQTGTLITDSRVVYGSDTFNPARTAITITLPQDEPQAQWTLKHVSTGLEYKILIVYYSYDSRRPRVFKNGIELDPFYEFKINNAQGIEILSDVDLLGSDQIDIKLYGTSGTNLPESVIANLDRNPNNDPVIFSTFDQLFPHFQSQIESLVFQSRFDLPKLIGPSGQGQSLGLNDYDHIYKQRVAGTKILKHSSSFPKAALTIEDDVINPSNTLRFASASYAIFIEKILSKTKELETTLDFDSMTSAQILDAVLTSINQGKNNTFAFAYSEMVHYGTPAHQRTVVVTTETQIALPATIESTAMIADHVYVYADDLQLTKGVDYLLDDSNVILITPVASGTEITIKIYNKGSLSLVPPTPAKLGLMPLYRPEIFNDQYHSGTVEMLRRHDGGKIPTYGDIRDQVLLEYELRVYNNSLPELRQENNLDLIGYVPGYSKPSGVDFDQFRTFLDGGFQKWAVDNGITSLANLEYDPADPFTWNYRKPGISRIGHWRSVYINRFETEAPHTRPWEMLGFTFKPQWWDTHYSWTDPVKRIALESALNKGLITEPVIGVAPRQDWRVSRVGPFPVDTSGNLLDPVAAGIFAAPTPEEASASWRFGDGGAQEQAWIMSPRYSFAVAEFIALNFAPQIIDRRWEGFLFKQAPSDEMKLDYFTQNWTQFKRSPIHRVNGKRILGYGHLASEMYQQLGASLDVSLADRVSTLDAKLMFPVEGFTDKRITRFLADTLVEQDRGNFIPEENYQIVRQRSAPVEVLFYSGIKCTIDASGGYRVDGFDKEYPYFSYFTPRTNQRINIPVGDFIAKEPVNFNQEPELLPYGTVFTSKQDAYDFIIGYGKYLESKGWEFQELDSNLGQLKDWRFAATQFVEWSNTRWDTGTSINISPGSNRLVFNHSRHEVKNLRDQFFEQFSIVNYQGKAIEATRLKVNRLATRTEILCPADSGIFGLRVTLVDYDHIVVFDQKTIFGDTLLDPLYNQEIIRIKFIGKRTKNWNGQAIGLGYLPEKFGLLANFETTVSQILDEYNSVEEGILNTALQKIGNYNIGIVDKSYLSNLLYSPSVVFEFQRGLLKKKGTPNAYDRLRRSDAVDVQGRESEIIVREEWMFNLGEFGGGQNFRWELQLKNSDLKLNPQVFRITPEFEPNSQYTLITDKLADSVVDLPPNDSRWVERPLPNQLFPQRNPNTQEGDQLVAGLLRLDEVDYSINNLEDLPDLAAYDNPEELFQDLYNIPSWLPEKDFVIGDKCRYNGKVYVSKANILGAETNTFQTTQWELGSEPKMPAVWVGIATAGNQDINNWQVMQLMDFELPIESICLGINTGDDAEITLPEGKLHNLTEGDYVFIAGADGLASIDGIHRVTDVVSSRKFRIDEYVPGCSYTGKLFVFRPVHFITYAELTASLSMAKYNYQDGMKLYLDNGIGNYTVYTYQGDTNSVNPIIVERIETQRTDPNTIKSVVVYDHKRNIPLITCEIFDPVKGFIPTTASKEINSILTYDPASYSSSTDTNRDIDPDAAWYDERVGTVWWDLSNTRYLDYEQGPLNQRIKYWGRLFPGSEIEIYEWVRSSIAPYDYNAAVASGQEENGQLLTGTARIELGADESSYSWSEREESNSDGSTSIYYYYWVKNRTLVPDVPGRKISAKAIADIITDPTSQGIPWFAAVAPDAFILANVASSTDDTNTSLQIKFRDPDQPDHKQWILIKENDPNAIIPDWLHIRLRDSILGFDQRIMTYQVTEYDSGTAYDRDDVVIYSGLYYRAFRDFQSSDVFYGDGSPVSFANQPWVRLYDFILVENDSITQIQGRDVPDARLHPFVKYGNRIRPRQQSWIKDRQLAITNFVEIANSLLASIPVVFSTLEWDRRLGNTNLVSGTNVYDVTQYWSYADWSDVDFNYETATIDVEYDSTEDLFLDTAQDNGTLGRVTFPDGSVQVFEYELDAWELRYATNGTIQINDLYFDFEESGTGWDSNVWDSVTWDKAPLDILFEFIQAFREDIFIGTNEGLYADLFFGMVHYIHSENPYVDWIVKSTYLTLLNRDARGLDQEAFYRKSITDDLVAYVNDVKPYHSKLREVLDQREALDTANLTITDSETKKIIMRYERHGDPEFRGEHVDGKPFWWLEPGWDRQPWDFSVEVDDPPYPHEPGTEHPTIEKVWSWDMRRADLEALIDTIYNGYSFGTPAELYNIIVEGNKFVQPEWEGYPEELVPLYPGETVEIRVQTNVSSTVVDLNTVSFRYFRDILGSVEITRIADSHKTTLAVAIDENSTEIELVDGYILSDVDKARGRPGVVWIGPERIEFWTRNANTLQDIVRGTLGTPIVNHDAGVFVFDGGALNIVPGPTELSNWGNALYPAWSAIGSRLHDGGNIQADFLLAKPGYFS